MASMAGIFSGTKQRGYMYRFACRYGIFRPYRSVPLEYTVPASKSVHITPLFRTGKNISRTNQFRAILTGTEKIFFFFFFFLSFVIFELLLGQNGNLFPLTY